ncbi:serine/threonine-protein kinase [Micromonospora vulcania]|uniref:non-specific serine/threonine protein kinase n=1 Tax=Micromonospora vulcania TaxID=1441873 RepID=A0ABW1H7T3_9ACTN
MTDNPSGGLPVPIVPGLTDLRVFARGGYATVYQATQISVGREVAVKVENRTLDSERDQARFLREARAAGRMSSHPHVVDLFDVGVTVDQHPYLIMELCDGSYAERMRNSPLDPAETRDLGVKIADALAHSHAAGVLHRDVKPANILYSHFNSAVLADFGLAVLAEARDASVTLEVLTPAYAPPEMFSHSPPSPAVDVYALCATLYAVMHGRPPRWQSERNPSLVTVLEMFNQPLPGLPGVPDGLIDVLRAGMANDPAERPSAVELHDLLASLPLGPTSAPVSGAPVSGGATLPGPYVAGQPVPRPSVEQAHPTVPSGRRWRRRWFFGGAGVLALAASATAGAWVADGAAPATSPSASQVAAPATGPLPGCTTGTGAPSALPEGVRCLPELECFGPVRIRGTRAEAARVDCAGRHTWETYAEGILPVSLVGAEYDEVVAAEPVRQVCNLTTFRLTTGITKSTGWHLEVLPPVDGSVDRTYRCLAGRGVDALTVPTLTGR